MRELIERLQYRIVRILRWSESYAQTDMVYLAGVWFWTNLNVVTSSVLALCLSAAFANLLPRESYGLYQYLLSLSGLVAAVMLSGMGSSVVQAVARGYDGVLRDAVRAQLRWAVIPAGAALATAAYYFLHGNTAIGSGLVIIAVCTPLIQTFGMFSGFLEGKRDFRRGFYFGFIVSTAAYVSLLVAIWWVKSPVWLFCINMGVSTLATLYAYREVMRVYAPSGHTDLRAISYGRHLSVLSTWGTIISQVDSVLVFHFLGPVPLAIYSFATLIPERIGSMFGFVGSASLPKLATQPLSYIRQNIGSKLLRVMLASAGLALVYVLASPLFFALVFPRYADAIRLTQWYAPIVILLAVTSVTNSVFYAKRLTREIYIYSLFQPLLLVALQVPLLLRFGIAGMIAARLITDLVSITIMLLMLFKPISHPDEGTEGISTVSPEREA